MYGTLLHSKHLAITYLCHETSYHILDIWKVVLLNEHAYEPKNKYTLLGIAPSERPVEPLILPSNLLGNFILFISCYWVTIATKNNTIYYNYHIYELHEHIEV